MSEPTTAEEIADMLSISGGCGNCGVVQDCVAGTLIGACQELERAGWLVKDGELLCYGCVDRENPND